MTKAIKITSLFKPSSYLFHSVPSFIPLFRININRIMALILIFIMDGGTASSQHRALTIYTHKYARPGQLPRLQCLILFCSPSFLLLHYWPVQGNRNAVGMIWPGLEKTVWCGWKLFFPRSDTSRLFLHSFMENYVVLRHWRCLRHPTETGRLQASQSALGSAYTRTQCHTVWIYLPIQFIYWKTFYI